MKYDAFISYRHLEKDMFVAKGIHKALEAAKIPRRIQKLSGKKRIQRVFRDQEELPIGSDLGENIEAALRESDNLIVICSPETRNSFWVMKEIDTFIAMHGRSNILAVLVDGEPEESFPPQIMVDDFGNKVEPLAADVRGLDKKDITAKIKSESLRLAAAIIGCDYDDLRQRHREMKMRRYMAVAAAFAVFGVTFGVYNAYSRASINENYQQKLINESRVLAKTSASVLEEGDRKTAALIAVEGLPHDGNDRPFVADAMYSLSNALGSYAITSSYRTDLKLHHDRIINGFSCDKEGTRLVSHDENECVYYWNVSTGELLYKCLPQYNDEGKDAIVAVGIYNSKAIVVSGRFLTAYDETGNVVWYHEFKEITRGAKFTRDKKRVAVMSAYDIGVYDCDSGDLVAEYEDKEGLYLNSDIDLNEDGDKVSVYSYTGQAVGYFDVKTSELAGVESDEENEYLACDFSIDGAMVIARATGERDANDDPNHVLVRKYDLKTGELIFEVVCEVDRYKTYNTVDFGTRIYTADGTSHRELIVRCDDTLVLLDLDTGEELGKFHTEYISEWLYHVSSSSIYTFGFGGQAQIVDIAAGTVKDTNLITAGNMDELLTCGDHVIYKCLSSQDIMVESILEDPQGIEVDNLEEWDVLNGAILSPDQKTYVIDGSTLDSEEHFYRVYNSSDNSEIGRFTIPGKSIDDMFYLDGDTVVIVDMGNGIFLYYYSISTGKYEKITVSEEQYISKYAISSNKNFIAFYTSNYMAVYDTKRRAVTASGEVFDDYFNNIRHAVISNDGKTVYFATKNEKAYFLDISDEDLDPVLEDYRIGDMVLSNDGTMLMTSCTDGKLRVFSIPDLDLMEEIDFMGDDYSSRMMFSEDQKKLYLNGADHLLRIYDLEKHEFVYESSESCVAQKMQEDTKNNKLLMSDYGKLYIFDLESYGFLGVVPDGQLYISDQNCILSYAKQKMYRFKVKTLEDLLQQVKEQFGDAQLTPSEKRKYNIG